MILKLITFIKQIKKIVTDKLFPQTVVELNPLLIEAEISHNNETTLQPIQQACEHCISEQEAVHNVIITITTAFNILIQSIINSKQYTVPDG